jgi:hypothetical protein
MVDPDNITQFHLDDWRLEEFLLFSIAVAGKTAKTVAPRIHEFLMEITNGGTHDPFGAIRGIVAWDGEEALIGLIHKHGIGCQTQRAKSFSQLVERGLNLRTCSVSDLEDVFGIGPKTARLFVMHSRQDAPPMAALDTHILKFLAEDGVDCPKSTPPAGPTYNRLEQEFLKRVPEGSTPAEFDLKVWKRYRR